MIISLLWQFNMNDHIPEEHNKDNKEIKKNYETFLMNYLLVFCSITDRPTDQVNYILNAHWLSKTFQLCIVNSSREIFLFPNSGRTDEQLNYRVAALLIIHKDWFNNSFWEKQANIAWFTSTRDKMNSKLLLKSKYIYIYLFVRIKFF